MHITWRAARPLFGVLALLWVLAPPVSAQTSGKIEGRVIDGTTNQPLVGAQVVVVGTGYGNITNADGYYFINNVPAGLHDVRAQFIGYQTTTVEQQRVLAGQTIRIDFRMSSQAVALAPITVQGEANPLVPRDKTVSKQIVTGDVVDQLPVDNVRAVITLQPGVVETGDGRGQVVRGGRPGEASVYVDGVLVRNFNSGAQSLLNVGTNAVEEVNVLLGGYGAEFGSAQSGIINYITRSGGTRWNGAFNFATDAFLPKDISWGHSRAEFSIGGPLISEKLALHLAATAEGFEDATPNFLDMRAADSIPVQQHYFIPTGTRTITGANGEAVTVTEFERWDEGKRQPFSNGDQFTGSGTLRWSVGPSTNVSFGAQMSRNQGMGFSGILQFRPKAIGAFVNNSNLFRASLDQMLFQTAESQANLKLSVAWGTDKQRSGQRADTVSLVPEGPDFLGFKFSPYEFLFDGKITYEKYIARIDSINQGLHTQPLTLVETLGLTNAEATPFFDYDYGADNPYGLLGYNYGQGLNGYFEAQEKTLTFDADFDWQLNRVHRIGAGVEWYKKEVTNLNIGKVSTFFHDVYRVKPTMGAVWLKDRMDIGEMVLDLGLRWDYFDSDAKYPELPGLVLPFVPDNTPEGLALCAAPPTQAGGTCMPNTFEQDAVSTISPRLGVAFPITVATNFRLSYGHFFQLPAFNDLFSQIFTDLSKSNTNSPYGRPINAMKAVQFEVGLSHIFNSSTLLDVTAYNKDKLADATYRIESINWPESRRGRQDGRVLTGLDFGNSKGIDVRVTRRLAESFTTIVGYSYLNARGTASDPLSYINSFGRFTDPVTGAPLSPAQALQFQDFDQTHKFSLAATANFGEDESALLKNTNIGITANAGSGLPYTRSSTPSASGRGASGARFTELINSSRMPWTAVANLRVTRGVTLMGTKVALFGDVQNLFNTRNQTNVYGFTGSPTDPGDIETEASGAVAADRTIASETNEVLRLQYERQQELLSLYGMADEDDAVLSSAEQKRLRALGYIHSNERIETFFGTPRRIRLGFEWVF